MKRTDLLSACTDLVSELTHLTDSRNWYELTFVIVNNVLM